MKIPFSWLKELFPTTLTPEEIAHQLTMLGIEVDQIVEDHVFEVSLTPNLAHASSLLGIARELSALNKTPWILPSFSLKESNEPSPIQVEIEDHKLCPRYSCAVIVDVKVGPSPEWLSKRLEQAGIRSVNNVVDITNYVLVELGQPLHAFDLDKIVEKVVVRRAKKGEKIVTLDGNEHVLSDETLLIADAKKPLAIAGVMGSKESEVSASTKRVLLEAALFDPTSIRRSARRIATHTEATRRFERGVDPNSVLLALERAAALIFEIASGTVSSRLDIGEKGREPKKIEVRLNKINVLLGKEFSSSEVEEIYHRLGFKVKNLKNVSLEVTVPTFRLDLTSEIDLVEEVARLYGFTNLYQGKEVARYRGSSVQDHPLFTFERQVRQTLLTLGLQELSTCDLISPQDAETISKDIRPERSIVKILNPSSQEESVLRPSLLPGLMRVVKFNVDNERDDILGFEVGRLHFSAKENYSEPLALAIVMSGTFAPHFWGEKDKKVDFFDLKGCVESFLKALPIQEFSFNRSTFHNFHPGRQAQIEVAGHVVGVLGQIHPKTAEQFGLSQEVYFAEMHLEDLLKAKAPPKKMERLVSFPGSYRDLTLTLPESIPFAKLDQVIKEFSSPVLEKFTLLDVYKSEKLGKELRNITLRFFYRDKGETISQQTIEQEHAKLLDAIQKKLEFLNRGKKHEK